MSILLRAGLLISLTCSAAQSQTLVRFGVLGLFHPREMVLESVGPQVVAVHTGERAIYLNRERDHRRLSMEANGNQIVINGTSVGSCVAGARDGGTVRFRLSIPGKINRVFEGKLAVTAHGGELTAVISIEREKAVASIVASEMSSGAPLEALRAQAVVTRSFLAGGARHRDFDFCDTTHCQFLRSPDDVSSQVTEAVASTRSLILSWRNQNVAGLYSSRCGGRTRSLADVGMDSKAGYPYYSVECKWCREHPVRWEKRLDPDTRTPESQNESARIRYARQWGWSALPGSSFSVRSEADQVILDGRSIGHSLGMCQSGAIGMALSGADFRSILAHYYPNTELSQLPE